MTPTADVMEFATPPQISLSGIDKTVHKVSDVYYPLNDGDNDLILDKWVSLIQLPGDSNYELLMENGSIRHVPHLTQVDTPFCETAPEHWHIKNDQLEELAGLYTTFIFTIIMTHNELIYLHTFSTIQAQETGNDIDGEAEYKPVNVEQWLDDRLLPKKYPTLPAFEHTEADVATYTPEELLGFYWIARKIQVHDGITLYAVTFRSYDAFTPVSTQTLHVLRGRSNIVPIIRALQYLLLRCNSESHIYYHIPYNFVSGVKLLNYEQIPLTHSFTSMNGGSIFINSEVITFTSHSDWAKGMLGGEIPCELPIIGNEGERVLVSRMLDPESICARLFEPIKVEVNLSRQTEEQADADTTSG